MSQAKDDLSPGLRRFLLLVFLCLGFLVIVHHEMWRDEWQAWLLANYSGSLGELFWNKRYEGHPGLWHLGLYAISRFTAQPLAMQLFHLLVAAGAAYVFLRFAPFSKTLRILFIFGYFPFFEYAVISRNYVPGVLLIFSFCALCRPFPRRNYLLLALVLFFLCQTNVYSLMIAISLGLTLILEGLLNKDLRRYWRDRKYLLAACLSIFVLGISASLYQIIPPPDSGFAVDWRFGIDGGEIIRTVANIWRSYVPIPQPQYHFWETNILSDGYLQFFFSLILLSLGLILLLRKPLALFLYLLGTLAIFLFTYVKYPGSLRHHGHLFILLMATWWLAEYLPSRELKVKSLNKIADIFHKNRHRLMAGLLSAHLLAAAMACGLDLFLPFSASRETARFIAAHNLDRMLLIGEVDGMVAGVAGHLHRPVYYPGSDRFGHFVVFDDKRRNLDEQTLINKTREITAQYGKEALLILNFPLHIENPFISIITKFEESIVQDENYYLYFIKATKTKLTDPALSRTENASISLAPRAFHR